MSERWKNQTAGGALLREGLTNADQRCCLSSLSAISSQGSFSVFFSGPSFFFKFMEREYESGRWKNQTFGGAISRMVPQKLQQSQPYETESMRDGRIGQLA